MTARAEGQRAFIARAGWDAAHSAQVAGDASNRRYDRLRLPDARTAILMDAPPDKGEDIRPFVFIASYLSDIGLSAPKILAEDAKQGFLLLEDLGDDLFARIIPQNPSIEPHLYAAAVDVLAHLHAHPPPKLATYDAALMTDMALLAFDWYQAAAAATHGRAEAKQALAALLEPIKASVLIQRDYHAENLIWLPARAGVARVGLLDFQDAMLGHPAYDLASILLDARRDVPKDLRETMLTRYITEAKIPDPAAFTHAFWALALQRNLRIIGVFARLCMRDGKAQYVDLIPRVWNHILTALEHISDGALAGLLRTALPEPTPETLQRIKAQCATRPTP